MSAIERYEQAGGAVSLLSDRDWNALERQAEALAKSGMLPAHLNNKTHAVMAAALTCISAEMPVTLTTIGQFYEVNGRIMPGTQWCIALAARHGVDIWFDDEEDAADRVTAYGQRGNGRVKSYTYSLADAQKAKLADKDTWKKYGQIMLRYRAASHLLRTGFPDVLMGVPPRLLDEGLEPVVDRKTLQAQAVPVNVDADTGEVHDEDDDITDAEVVEDETPEQPAKPPRRTEAGRIREEIAQLPDDVVDSSWVQQFAIAVRGLADSTGVDADALRHALVYAGTDGRVQSSKEVRVGEVGNIRAVFKTVADGDTKAMRALIAQLPFDGPEAA